ncbi:MAG: hypothetical protein ABI377_07000 [Devosia sp.]
MKSIFHKLVARVVLFLLALTALAAAETPAWALPYVNHDSLQATCAANGGYFSSSESGHNYFCVKGGHAVLCDDYKPKQKICVALAKGAPPKSILGFPVGPEDAAMVTIPCDPFLCKIFCGGKPYCTFGDTVGAMPAKVQDFSAPSLVTPVPGGGSAGPAPAGVIE